jgi:N6-L-threonylcarbamoyladenine synthase
MRILAIDTSCDETAAALTEGVKVYSNIVWSQASSHAKFGGVMPSLAQRMHEERIDWVTDKARGDKGKNMAKIDAIAVTTGPGLSIALGVGINKAKALALKYKKPLIEVNHIEAHILSSLINLPNDIKFPAYGLCVSGGNTLFVLIEKIGKYKILAQTVDDALGEALDKGARMLGLGYPGGAILEKFARLGDPKVYPLPTPLVNDKERNRFSYSGLKTALMRLVNSLDSPSKKDIYNLAATYQEAAFIHIEKVLSYHILQSPIQISSLLLGGGVAANVKLRKSLRKLGKKHGFHLYTPYSNKLCGDNAAMIGVCAFLNPKYVNPNKIDRDPRAKIST